MADHRREQILDAVVTTLTGLTQTGDNVFRGRVHALPDSQIPALCIYQGEDREIGQYAQAKIDRELDITVEALVKTSTTQVDELLNLIAKEVCVALQADYTQGLSFVINTIEGDTGKPELSGEGEKPAAAMTMQWKFHYRRSRTDPSA